MMAQTSIKCPSCRFEFPLDEILLESIKEDFESKNNEKLDKIKRGYEREKEKIKKTVKDEVNQQNALALKEFEERVQEKEQTIGELQAKNLELKKRERDIADKEKNFEQELEKETNKAKSETEKEIKEKYQLEIDREKNKTNEQIRLLNNKLDREI